MRNSKDTLLSVIAILVFSFHTFGQENPKKPNIILILADDLGYADLSLTGSLQINTPNIDALAREGVNFTQAYVSAPVCSPSRAGLLTGKNQVSFGYDNNLAANQTGFDPEYGGLPVGQMTMADRLKEVGYVTGLIGKWHLGEKEQFHPVRRGFDEFWGYLGGGHHYFKSEENGQGYLRPIISNYKTPQPITYITDDKGDECVDFIKKHKNGPFFLYASFNAPHAPMHALEDDLALFSHIEDEKRRTYLAMVHRLDLNIGKIIQALKSEHLEENTMVVFLSDNGGPSDQNASLNAPYNGQKGILLEGGIRVPFIIKWKGELPAGITYSKAISSLDLMPTFLAIAGIKPTSTDQLDGVDLLPFLKSENNLSPHENLKWRFTISAGILEDKWKLIRLPDRLPLLFDLSQDLSEQHNVALENIEVTRSLLKKLGDWDMSLPHPLFLEGAEWKPKQLDLYDQPYSITQPKIVGNN
ncbi:sulfatase-like hydrolase/transferase [Aquiflexum sp. TKW24L]|uniref:sulfatase-like hydrolase/transferase n=1 Tax=Aquiflexum sp. TKW24L TaxID=2942212 RepID=UPI0020C13903|nr:sulfatase-like hydrolase/transferase [Aquiflexum sp. TKW24L]MCL6258258.1 sulfatase-like hydrolase/transferase [Aquiflexum sp. TKW24L]